MTLAEHAPRLSATLAINEEIKARARAGEDILHLGFGEAGVPVHPLLREALSTGSAGGAAYGEVAGDPALREAVAGFYCRRGIETEPWQILVGPGSKALLYALMLALEGDIVLPRPSWVSYEPQATLAGKRVVRVPIPIETGGIPDPEQLGSAVRDARRASLDPRVLLITQPDNPTGTFPSRSRLAQVLTTAESCGLLVVCDEIYADLVHADGDFSSAAELAPANCVVTGGLSKSLALGGWRIGVVRVPPTAFGRLLLQRLRAIASEVWSCITTPVASVARLAYDEPPEIIAHVRASCRLHEQVSNLIYAAVRASGAACRPPSGAFYLYPDLDHGRETLARRGIDTGVGLARALLDDHGVGVLPGEAFGDDQRALRFRVATSLLYGPTEDARWAALDAAATGNAARLPAVVHAASRLQGALASVLGGDPSGGSLRGQT